MKFSAPIQKLVDRAAADEQRQRAKSVKPKKRTATRQRAAVVVLSERAQNARRLKDARGAAKGRVELLRYQLRKAREQSAALQKQIRTKRDATRPRLQEQVKRFRAKWRAWVNARIKEMRDKHRTVWNKRLDAAHAAVLRAQFELAAERGVQGDLRQFSASQRRAKRSLPKPPKGRTSTTRIRREESDHEVEQNIDPALVGVWREVKDRIRTDYPNKSRSEAFQEWADENPEDVIALRTEQAYTVAELGAELAESERLAYEEPQTGGYAPF